MGRKSIILLSFALLLLCAAGAFIYIKLTGAPKQYFVVNFNDKETRITLLHQHEVQKAERKYVDKKLEFLFELGNTKEAPLITPIFIKTDDQGNIYVQDSSDRSIKIYSPDGKFIKKLGGQGNGPGEFETLLEFQIANGNTVHALDYNKIAIFNDRGIVEKKLNQYGEITNFIPLQGGDYLCNRRPYSDDDFILGIHNSEGKGIRSLERFYKTDLKMAMESSLFNGDLFKTENNIIFISRYFNLIFIYKGEKIDKLITTIDKEEHPALIVKRKKDFGFADVRHIPIINLRTFVVNDSLYIMSRPALKEFKKFILDVYDTRTGKYSHSLRFDHYQSHMTFGLAKNRFFIIDAEWKVKVYKFE